MRRKIVVTYKIPDCGFNTMGKEYEIIFPQQDMISEEEINKHIGDADALVSVFGLKLHNKLIDRAKKLKLIANFGVGYDNIDIKYASEKGITVTNTPDPVTEPTAELAMGLMISVARKIAFLNQQLKLKTGLQTGVMKNLSTTLTGKTLGIIGMGAIGQALARRALAFGMNIVYCKRKKLSPEIETKYNAKKLSLEDLMKTSDVVSLNTPLTDETFHLIGSKELNCMKKSAYLINTARGSVVNQPDLIDALKNNIIAGAGLDVYENEPHIPDALLNLDNVVLTPHTGTATTETRKEMSLLVTQIIQSFFNQQLDKYIVTP
ncbi:hydroxyacid dehydrogenase [Labilibacter sediminis]|nr:hydroxyacid dehydrogenase [Labilibacter sediminis]